MKKVGDLVFFLRLARDISLIPRIREHQRIYDTEINEKEIIDYQLDAFNKNWTRVREEIPYYNRLSNRSKLPVAFSDWNEVISCFSPISRKDIQVNPSLFFSNVTHKTRLRSTGGSTSEPLQFPVFKSELDYIVRNNWLGRFLYGITPSDRLFTIWGHSHLFGKGLRGYFKKSLKALKDKVFEYYRFSAYDISDVKMNEACHTLLRFKPDYMIGYSVALDRFARSNQSFREELRKIKLKAIIATAESFPSDDSWDVLEDLFGAPVAMEYGSAETSVIGHTRPGSRKFYLFWRDWFFEALPVGEEGSFKLLVTSLNRRAFPLIRYDLGDLVKLDSGCSERSLTCVSAVIGRCNDYLVMADGSTVHSELITHVVKSIKGLKRYQVVQRAGKLDMSLVFDGAITEEIRNGIRSKLCTINPLFADITIKQSEALRQTVAGKTPLIIRLNQ